ncbi:MAG TPA: hypothetical protein VKV32_06435 [Stellaceae bacterium]|nr:hypothetical protein [Stellaceae bacterium]
MKDQRSVPAHKSPADTSADGDTAVLDRDEEQDERGYRPGRVERRGWRGEGVVGNYHTD